MTNNESLARTTKDLMYEEAFYGIFLMMLQKRFSKQVPTAGVGISGINYYLLINEDFWAKQSADQKKGLLKHELLHIAFFHLTDFDHMTDPELANIAKDLEINQYIKKEWLPEGGMLLELFPELDLDERAGSNYYYEKLQEAKQKGNCPNLNAMLEAMSKGDSTCTCNGEDGIPVEIKIPDHSSWGDSEELSEAEKKLMHNQTKHVMNSLAEMVAKSRGTIPGEMQSILDRINSQDPPKFDWRGYLRRFAGGSVKVYTKKTRRKHNKRYSDNPGLKIKPKKHILVAIDTSGSVSNKELIEFMQEINHIYRTGADVTIVQADAAIRHIAPYNPKGDYKIYGRGGTSFDPVIDYYNANTKKYTCLIYLTDGEAPAPDKIRGRVLWALSSQSNMTDHLPGTTIKLN